MPRYRVQDTDGTTLTLEGDSPPTEQELTDIFAQHKLSGVRLTPYEEAQMKGAHDPGMQSGTELTTALAENPMGVLGLPFKVAGSVLGEGLQAGRDYAQRMRQREAEAAGLPDPTAVFGQETPPPRLTAETPLLPDLGATGAHPESSDAARLLSRWSSPEGIAMFAGSQNPIGKVLMAAQLVPGVGKQIVEIARGEGSQQEKRDRINDLAAMALLMIGPAAKPGLKSTIAAPKPELPPRMGSELTMPEGAKPEDAAKLLLETKPTQATDQVPQKATFSTSEIELNIDSALRELERSRLAGDSVAQRRAETDLKFWKQQRRENPPTIFEKHPLDTEGQPIQKAGEQVPTPEKVPELQPPVSKATETLVSLGWTPEEVLAMKPSERVRLAVKKTPPSRTAPSPSERPTEPAGTAPAGTLESPAPVTQAGALTSEAAKPITETNTGLISADESKRLDAITESNRPRLDTLSEDQLKKVGMEFGIRLSRNTKEKLLSDAHPDDLKDALDQVAPTVSEKVGEKVPPEIASVKPVETPSQQKKGFDTKQAKAQKKFLLSEIDKAIEEAPDTPTGEFRSEELKADWTRANTVFQDKPFGPESTAWTEQKAAEFEPLFKKYNVPEGWPARPGYKNVLGDIQDAAEAGKYDFNHRVDLLKAAIEHSNRASIPKVVIDVPGDGYFEILNTKQALKDARERADKFPTSAPRGSSPGKTRESASQPATVGKVNVENVSKAASLATTTDETRKILQYLYSDGKQTVATDGRRMLWFKFGLPGASPKGSLFTPEGKKLSPAKEKEIGKFPNFKQVIPENPQLIFKGLDASRLFTIVKQAIQVTTEKESSIKIYRNPDGSLGIAVGKTEVGSYTHNVKDGAKTVAAVNPEYFIDILNAARKVGHEKIDLYSEMKPKGWDTSFTGIAPIVVRAPGFEGILMPMRLEGPGPGGGEVHSLSDYDFMPPDKAKKAMQSRLDFLTKEDLMGAETDWLKEQLGISEPSKPGEGPIGMGGAVPSEFERSPETATSIKNATVDRERQVRGLQPAMEPARRSFGTVWDRAMALVDRDPGYQDRLLAELRDKPRALTDLEDALLLHRQIDLQNEYGKATRDLAQAFDDGRTEAVEAEKVRSAAILDQIQDIYDIGKAVGTETGRGLNARKMMAFEDFSLAKMTLDKRAAVGGRPLTEAETVEIERLNKLVEATQKAYDDYRAKAEERIRQAETEKAIADIKSQKSVTFDKRILDAAEKIVVRMENAARDASTRLKDRLSRMSAGVDPTIVMDAAIVGSAKIARKGLDLARFTDEMIREYGEKLRPMIDDIWKKSNELVDSATAKAPEPVKRAVKKTEIKDFKKATIEAVKEKSARGENDKITWLVQRLARKLVENGITEREALIDAVHEVLKDAIPEITRRQTMDAISGYGDYKQLSKDEITVKLRGMKGEMQQLAKLEDMAKGQPPLKSGVERRTPTEAERKLIKEVNDAKLKFQVPVDDPNTQLKSALDTLKTTLRNRITDYEDRLARKDFAPRPRRSVQLDETAARLKAENERVKKRWREALVADRMKNRTTWEKILDWGTKYRRAGVLSSPMVIPKLISAGIQRMISLPIEEGWGWMVGRLPGVSKVAERAPLEGAGINLSAEMRGYAAMFTKGMNDAYNVLKSGNSDLDILYGKAHESYTGEFELASRILAAPGHLHGMIKAPIKRAVFERSVQRLAEFYAKQGLDITSDVVKTRIAVEAYKAGNRAIFLQDNLIASKVSAFLAAKIDPSTGHPTPGSKVLSTVGRITFPIIRVPVNIVAETMQYAGGLVSGSIRIGVAFKNGIENLPPEKADLIMRELKKGSVGAAVLLLGYFNADTIGGYYQRNEKKKKGDVPFGKIRVYGVDVPAYLLHNPLLACLQIGATVRHVAEEKLHKRDKDAQGLAAGIGAAALGLIDEVPFMREQEEISKLQNPYERGRFLGEQAKSILIPAVIQKAAEWTDPGVKRAPTTVPEYLKTGVPGLRQQVPKKK